MRILTPVLALAVTFALPCQRLCAWNSTGHMTVAKLAWEKLDPGQKMRALQVLQKLPFFEKFMGERPRPDGVEEMEWVFLNAATWPDWLRDFAPPHGKRIDPEIGKFHIRDRHFINLPVIAPADADALDPKKLQPDMTKENIVLGLNTSMKTLRTGNVDEDSAIALAWVLHLAGDIAQPLHCAMLFSKTDFPKGDEGGNLESVKIGNRTFVLHAYWDDLVGISHHFGEPPFPANASKQIYMQVKANFDRLSPMGPNEFAAQLMKKDFNDWAAESLELAKAKSYAFDGTPIALSAKPAVVDMPDGYDQQARQTADRQIALAGLRLADLVKQVPAGGNDQ